MSVCPNPLFKANWNLPPQQQLPIYWDANIRIV
uniref:Uncharacterized protein n=1 Tax=Anguilla anguilla TaxID=7936 RepID=A0A0E9WL06_ANGAN